MWPNPKFAADLVTFTEEIFNGKLHFLCSVVVNELKETTFKNIHQYSFLCTIDHFLKVTSAKNYSLSSGNPWYVINEFEDLKKKCFVLEISRFLCFCEIYRFQNLWRQHKHC